MIRPMGRARVVAVANQKGGVAKTTSVHSLGTALAERGMRALLVDLDPQACLTWSTGTDPDALERSLHDVLLGRCDAADAIVKVNDVQLLPSTIDVAGAEGHLLSKTGREYVLRRALETGAGGVASPPPRAAASGIRRGADRLPAVARHLHDQRPHGRVGGV